MFVDMPHSYKSALVRLKDNPAEERHQIELVSRAIQEIENAIEGWRAIEASAASTETDRREARERIVYRVRDFGGQRCNVKSLLSRIGSAQSGIIVGRGEPREV